MNKLVWYVSFTVVGVLLGAGVLILVTRLPRGKPVVLLPAPTPVPITVYVSGSVNLPGLYSLPMGSRVNAAIQAAGGFSADANSSEINLAELLVDGEQVDVPSLQSISESGNSSRSTTELSLKVDINTATLEELDSLPEIGPITAQSIIDYRELNGPFTTIEDLLEVDGIGQVTFDKIRDLITVGTFP